MLYSDDGFAIAGGERRPCERVCNATQTFLLESNESCASSVKVAAVQFCCTIEAGEHRDVEAKDVFDDMVSISKPPPNIRIARREGK